MKAVYADRLTLLQQNGSLLIKPSFFSCTSNLALFHIRQLLGLKFATIVKNHLIVLTRPKVQKNETVGYFKST